MPIFSSPENQGLELSAHCRLYLLRSDAIRSLSRSGFDIGKLSLVGKGMHSEEHPVGFYTMNDKIKSWGGVGAFWGFMLAPAVFFLPLVGLLAMAGPVVSMLVGALEGAVVVGGLSALGAVLTQTGASNDQAIKFESALKADKYVLMIHGSTADVANASSILSRSSAHNVA